MRGFLVALILSGFALSAADAAEPLLAESAGPMNPEPKQWSLSVRWENDTFGGTDRFYTNGVSFSLARSGSSCLDPLADRLPWGMGRRTVSYEFGQIMVTPVDTSRPIPDPNDRPYTGILYMALSLHVDLDNSYHGLKFITGVVGPSSLAEETQKEVHRWVDSSQPQGWDYQLRDEPVVNLVYEHRRKFRLMGETHGFAIEMLPAANVMLGNVLTQGQVSSQFRFGYNIPDDFGTTLMRGMVHLPPPRSPTEPRLSSKLGMFVYGGANINLVLRDISLDGNTGRQSPSVEREWLVPAAEIGIAVATQRFMASFSHVFWGREFKRQQTNSEFGAFTVTYRF